MTVICRILVNQSNGAPVIVEIVRANGTTQRTPIARTQDFSMNFGDRIKAVSGQAVVMINPGTQAGAFIISPQAPKNDYKHRAELEIEKMTTKIIHRGKITVAGDIGGIRGGTATSR